MSTRRYRWVGTSEDELDEIIEAGAGATLEFLQRTPWVEVTVADGTRDLDLDDHMADKGYVPDTTGPTIIVSSGPHTVGTEQTILVDATTGPISVDMPVTSTRLGNDVLVMKIDSSANAVTVTRAGAETVGYDTTQTLAQRGEAVLLIGDNATANWNIAGSTRAQDIYIDNSLTELTSTNVGDAITEIFVSDSTAIKSFVAGEALTAGDVLTLNTSGEVIRTESSIASDNWRVVGIAKAAALSGATVQVYTKHGSCPPIRFGSVPGAATNGSTVWVSATTGEATLSPPTTSGNTLFIVGTLQGADGATTTPAVMLNPQFIAHRR